jgi:hypothetical protein
MSGFQLNLWCYPWDLADEGIDRALDRLQGEAGVTGISVATHYHSVDQLRPHADLLPKGVSSRRFRSAGGAQFQPEARHYAATRFRPVVAEWVRKSNPLAAIAEVCAKRGLNLRAWHVCLHSSITVARWPAGAIKDVFGDASSTWLCPSNPDVRELLRGMIADLSEVYPFEAIELESAVFPTDLHVHAHRKVGFDCGPAGDWLRSLCFCESCRQQASQEKSDVRAAEASARVYLDKVLSTGDAMAMPIAALLAAEPALAAYADWRCRQVTSLIQLVRSTCGCRLVVQRAGNPLWSGADYAKIAAHCDALMPLYYESAPDRLEAVVEQAAGEVGGVDRVELGLYACTPPCSDSAGLVAAVKKAVELGVRSVNVYHYGLIPLRRLEWVRQASRYARREA